MGQIVLILWGARKGTQGHDDDNDNDDDYAIADAHADDIRMMLG